MGMCERTPSAFVVSLLIDIFHIMLNHKQKAIILLNSQNNEVYLLVRDSIISDAHHVREQDYSYRLVPRMFGNNLLATPRCAHRKRSLNLAAVKEQRQQQKRT